MLQVDPAIFLQHADGRAFGVGYHGNRQFETGTANKAWFSAKIFDPAQRHHLQFIQGFMQVARDPG